MYHIKTLNNIAPKGLAELPAQQFTVNSGAESCVQGILVRSVSMHEAPLPEGLLAVARAGAGVNNIPVPACSEQGIVVFNTPGANANAVMELVLAGLVLASRDVAGGIAWAKTLAGEADAAKQVEKGKSRFAGPELLGKTLGVVGLGAIGVRVANLAVHLGMNVLGYDPYLSIDAAWSLSRHVHHCTSLSQLYSQSDYITLHLPATKETTGMLNAAAFAQMKQGVRILNFARRRAFQRPGACAGAGKRALCALCNGFSHAGNTGPARLRVHPPSGGLHTGKRGELRRNGRAPASRLPLGRQHCKQRKLPRRLHAARRRRACMRHSPQRARHSGGHHAGGHGGKAEH